MAGCFRITLKEKDKPYLLDGPMGTELDRRGADTSLPLWSSRALMKNPDLVRTIHEDYIIAGADIITTNTFRTQERTLLNAGFNALKGKELTNLAVELAIEAKKNSNKPVLIAGSIAPLEDCYSPHLVPEDHILIDEFPKMINQLAESGVDIFLIETMNTFREARQAYLATKEYPDIPVILSFTCATNGSVLGSDPWSTVLEYFTNKVELISVNCSSIEGSNNAINVLNSNRNISWGVYPNFGEVDVLKGWKSGLIDKVFESSIENWLKYKPRLIGTCCGATPSETAKIRKLIDKF